MRPTLTAEMARIVVEERLAAAERFRQQKEARLAAAAAHVDGDRSTAKRPRIRERLAVALRLLHS